MRLIIYNLLLWRVFLRVGGEEKSLANFTELETLTASQRTTLQKLKNSVSSIVPHEYMTEDIWLVKFLQVQSFSERKAAQQVRESMKWRKENKVEEWRNPSLFSEFEKDFPVYLDGLDKTGRPIFEGYFGDWNLRSVALNGKIKKFTWYALSFVEAAHAKMREQQGLGKNVTEFVILANMDGFTVINQGCPACLPFFLGFIVQLERNWPNTMFRCILVNTPDSFEIVLNVARPVMSPQTRAAVKVFGANKAKWKPYLDNLIDPDQISEWFGGSKERKPGS